MSAIYPVSGSKLYIGSKITNGDYQLTAANFASQTWTEIDGWASMGTLGDTQEMITQNLINRGRTAKVKGTRDAGDFENQFVPLYNDPGQTLLRAAVEDCYPYAFKVEMGADCLPESTVTISVATPGVITWLDHGLLAGQTVVFSTTGTLPTGLSPATTYYVLATGLTDDTFTVSTTPGGAAIDTTGAGSGIQTATAAPAGLTKMFYALAASESFAGGDANTVQMMTTTLGIVSNIVTV